MLRAAVLALCLCLAVSIPTANHGATWRSGPNKFASWSVDELKSLMGTIIEPLPEKIVDNTSLPLSSIPESFDARDQWGSCIHPIRNQEKCGSCWAFGASEAFSDRLCIATGNKTDVVLSAEDLVSCDIYGDKGCQGGIPHLAWAYMEFEGIVSDSCFPYTAGNGTAAPCVKKCQDGSEWTPHKVKLFSTKGYKTESAIQTAIMTDGPAECAFTVYEDFMSYTTGVYTHTTGQELGGHAVKMIGWGVDAGTPYWLIANSWGPTWGEQGFFRIKRGSNECGIESGVVAGMPKL